jgi:DNA-binding response OmpR family regulator
LGAMATRLDTSTGQAVRALRPRNQRDAEVDRGRGSGERSLTLAKGARRRKLAVLDCDSGFLVVLGKRLELAGWEHQVLTKRISIKKAAALDVDALIVDAAMIGAGRLKWLKTLCDQRPEMSVIVCPSTSTVAERVSALRSGVDDWLAKPCHPEELIVRVESATLHRWRSTMRDAEPVSIGEIEIRPNQFQAFVDGVSLGLTRREYQLLELLCGSGGEILPRERIYECLWGYEMARNDRSVDVFVHKLRRKIERRSPYWTYIHTHFGVGYRLAAQPALQPVGEVEALAA